MNDDNFFDKAAKSLPGHWCKDVYADGNGNYCAAGHMLLAMGYIPEQMTFDFVESSSETEAIRMINKIAAEMFPDRVRVAAPFIADLNDHPDTTEEEIVSVLEKAAVAWGERSALWE